MQVPVLHVCPSSSGGCLFRGNGSHPIVHPEDAGRGMFRQRVLPDKRDEQIDAGGAGESGREYCTSGTTDDDAKLLLHVGQTPGATSPRVGDGGQTFSENPPRTLGCRAEEATDVKVNMDGNVCPWQVSQGPLIVAVGTGSRLEAEGAPCL